jgi:hypothetical protein
MNNIVSRLRFLSRQIIQKQKILFTFQKIRFMGHLILGEFGAAASNLLYLQIQFIVLKDKNYHFQHVFSFMQKLFFLVVMHT